MRRILSDIEGFENCEDYVIGSDGSVFSFKTMKYLEQSTDSKGYKYIDLRGCNNARIKNPKVHRLVMLCFGEDDKKPQINHLDGNKLNNNVSNLEWCTNRENREHAIKNGLKDEVKYGIAQYDLGMNLINVFDTCSEAMGSIGKNPKRSGQIGRVVRGKRKTAYGYIWKQYEGSTTITGK
ncbi:MAG: HNH endonuclease [Vallitaleaceae bacterium]|jgi:hypothetical protein|nr:HNH endonuclease [Vallitaleaceae bacterium]